MPKFIDIEHYMTDGHYQVSIPMHDVPHYIRRYEENFGLQVNPDFQRGHVWTEDKQIAFVEHILKAGKGSNIIRFNNPFWMSGRKPRKNDYQDMVLVDGLQRVTAITRFVQNEIPAFGYLYNDYEDAPSWTDHVLLFNVNNLKSREQVLQWYLEINAGGVVHTDEELDKVRDLLAAERSK